jgi:hypothetical protein
VTSPESPVLSPRCPVCGAEAVRAVDGPCTRGMGATGAWGYCGAERVSGIHEVLPVYGGHDFLGPTVCSAAPSHAAPADSKDEKENLGS